MSKVLVLAILVLMTAPAHAQETGGCSNGQTAWVPASKEGCKAAGGVYYERFGNLVTITTPSNTSGSIISGASTIQCPADREPVIRSNGLRACAKDLTEPER